MGEYPYIASNIEGIEKILEIMKTLGPYMEMDPLELVMLRRDFERHLRIHKKEEKPVESPKFTCSRCRGEGWVWREGV